MKRKARSMGGVPRWDQAVWFKSVRSNGSGNCVEVAFVDGVVGVRDSKDPNGGVLEFAAENWAAFVAAVRSGRLDD
jgi:hypothetical protein